MLYWLKLILNSDQDLAHIIKPTTQTTLSIPAKNILDKFTIIRDLFKFLQPGLISSTIFRKKLDFPTVIHKDVWTYTGFNSQWLEILT